MPSLIKCIIFKTPPCVHSVYRDRWTIIWTSLKRANSVFTVAKWRQFRENLILIYLFSITFWHKCLWCKFWFETTTTLHYAKVSLVKFSSGGFNKQLNCHHLNRLKPNCTFAKLIHYVTVPSSCPSKRFERPPSNIE